MSFFKENSKIKEKNTYVINHFNFIDRKDISFKKTNINNIHFNNCNFNDDTSFLDSNMKNCQFIKCDFNKTMFICCKLENILFEGCTISNGSYEDSLLRNVIFRDSKMPQTHFLDATIESSQISNGCLNDTIFFGKEADFFIDEETQKTHNITKPITSIVIDPENRGVTTPKAYKKLHEVVKSVPIRISSSNWKISKEYIDKEVINALDKIKNNKDDNKKSIPVRLLEEIKKNPSSYISCNKIISKAKTLSKYTHGFYLPGGNDIQPTLYGEEKHQKTLCDDSYQRSILELSMIHESFEKGVPLMAVCRGFQMVNIYFGSKLEQNIPSEWCGGIETSLRFINDIYHMQLPEMREGHWGPQCVSIENKSSFSDKRINGNIKTIVGHHQGISRNNDIVHLTTSITYNDLIKGATLSYSGATPYILLQIHPEFYNGDNKILSEKNDLFFTIFKENINTQKSKKTLLKTLLQTGMAG